MFLSGLISVWAAAQSLNSDLCLALCVLLKWIHTQFQTFLWWLRGEVAELTRLRALEANNGSSVRDEGSGSVTPRAQRAMTFTAALPPSAVYLWCEKLFRNEYVWQWSHYARCSALLCFLLFYFFVRVHIYARGLFVPWTKTYLESYFVLSET